MIIWLISSRKGNPLGLPFSENQVIISQRQQQQ